MSDWELTDEEISWLRDNWHLDRRSETVVPKFSQVVAKAQAKKLVQWLEERIVHYQDDPPYIAIGYPLEVANWKWQALKQEVGL